MTGIPKGITRRDVLQAIKQLDAGATHPFGPSRKFDLVHEDRRYAPKAVLGLAARRLAGRALRPEDFSGGDQTNDILEHLGFKIIPKDGTVLGTRCWTHYWKNDTWDEELDAPLDHAASNVFAGRVSEGDRVYVVTVLKGRIYLGGVITVDAVVDQAEAERRLGSTSIWPADDHVIARDPGPFVRDRQVADEVARALRFLPHGEPMVFKKGAIDTQTMRGVRELTPESAALLDRELEEEPTGRAVERALRDRRDVSATDREAIVRARVGQGRFREDLQVVERGCRVTGVTDPALLRASHIKPWAVSDNRERLDPNNGLLLAPHVDVLFDRGYFSFEADGTVLVSKQLDRAVLEAWGLEAVRKVAPFSVEQAKYLAHHQKHVFKKRKD